MPLRQGLSSLCHYLLDRAEMTPLAKRLPRELKNNIGKYLGIFLLMCGSIALTSGFLLAAHSIGRLIDGMRDEYAIEDGRFTTSFEATEAQLDAARDAADGVGGVAAGLENPHRPKVFVQSNLFHSYFSYNVSFFGRSCDCSSF